MARPSLGIVGAGKVGGTLARLLYARGYSIQVVYSRNSRHAEVLSYVVKADVAVSINHVVNAADLIFLTVPDDVIELIGEAVTVEQLNGKAVVHTSGVHDDHIMESLAQRGAMIGSLHPIYPFANVDDAVQGLPGATFGLQTQSFQLWKWLSDIVQTLDGRILKVDKGQKALYHSALVFASNYGVTLYAIAERLLKQSGANTDEIAGALLPLLDGMIRNLGTVGIPDALTGPLIRGDAGTVNAHLKALQKVAPDLSDLYTQLAYQTLPLAQARNVDTKMIEMILRKKMDDADNHT